MCLLILLVQYAFYSIAALVTKTRGDLHIYEDI